MGTGYPHRARTPVAEHALAAGNPHRRSIATLVDSVAMRLVLASASPARRSVLQAAGIDPVVRISGVDEDAITAALGATAHEDLVLALARAKADAVADAIATELPDAVVVGCDSMLSLAGEVLGKPGTPEVARARWADMAGRNGRLLTGHAVVRLDDGTRTDSASGTKATVVRFSAPTEYELDSYLATGEPLHVAGGFTIDGRGAWFVDGVDGDPSSVVGISLPLTRDLLADVGLNVVDLWH